MDEQQHRRRRQRPEEPASEQPTLSPVHEEQPHTQEPPQPDGEQAHHRRRRAAGPQAAEQPEAAPKTEREKAPKTEKKTGREKANEPAPDDIFWHPESEMLDRGEVQHEKKKRFGLIANIDAAICRIGDLIIAAVKAIALLVMGLFAGAVQGLSGLLKRAGGALRSTKGPEEMRVKVHTGKRVRKNAPARETASANVTIEPTRPQDYQGMGERRAHHVPAGKKRTVRPPKKRVSVMYSAVMAGLVCVAMVSAYMVGSILWRSVSTKMLNNSLSERYAELSVQHETEDEGEDPFAGMSDEEVAATLESHAPADEDPFAGLTEAEIARMLKTSAPQEDLMLAALEEMENQKETDSARLVTTPAPQAVKTTKFHQRGGDALPEMEALYEENSDLIGWLRMEEILDLPVVYKDNEYYLTHDFYKNKSASGTIFLDENHPFRENTQNLLLHGHNMKDGTMFGRLVQYETNLQFLKNNPFIQYSTLWKKEQYVIFAVLHVSLDMGNPKFFNYFTHHTFASDAQFESYVRDLQTRSVFAIPVDVEPSDALLTLSTCLDDDRLVIVARRLREGETKSQLRHIVQLATRQY